VDRTGWALVLAVLNRCVLLPESWLISEMDLREIGCEDGKWAELAQDRVQCSSVSHSVSGFGSLHVFISAQNAWSLTLPPRRIAYICTLRQLF